MKARRARSRVNFGNGQVHEVDTPTDGYRLIAAQDAYQEYAIVEWFDGLNGDWHRWSPSHQSEDA